MPINQKSNIIRIIQAHPNDTNLILRLEHWDNIRRLGLFYQNMNRLFYLAVWSILVLPMKVLAQSSGSGTGPGSSGSGVGPDVVLTNPIGADTIPAILDNIINFMLIVAAPIAVIMTIYAAYLFITAGDNQEKVKTARKTLMYVIIGVAILILSKGIVSLTKSFLDTTPAPIEPSSEPFPGNSISI